MTKETTASSWLRRYGPSLIPPRADYELCPLTACRDVFVTEPLAPRGTRPVTRGGFSFACIRSRHTPPTADAAGYGFVLVPQAC